MPYIEDEIGHQMDTDKGSWTVVFSAYVTEDFELEQFKAYFVEWHDRSKNVVDEDTEVEVQWPEFPLKERFTKEITELAMEKEI